MRDDRSNEKAPEFSSDIPFKRCVLENVTNFVYSMAPPPCLTTVVPHHPPPIHKKCPIPFQHQLTSTQTDTLLTLPSQLCGEIPCLWPLHTDSSCLQTCQRPCHTEAKPLTMRSSSPALSLSLSLSLSTALFYSQKIVFVLGDFVSLSIVL